MKIVHISNSVSNSSANTKLHNALLKQEIQSQILVLCHSGDIKETFDLERSFFRKVYDVILNYCEENHLKKINFKYGFPFSTGNKGYSLYKKDIIKEADVIHLHWICGILNAYEIKRLQLLGKPIVWTCHDSWPFTGGCHVRYGCTKYENQCGCCDMIQSKKENDLSYQILKKKKKFFKDNSITFIAPSSWMTESIKNSNLFHTNRIVMIPNAIDTDKYRPLNELELKNNIGSNKWKQNINILFGAGDIRIPYKGMEYLKQLLKYVKETKPDIASKIVLHIVGQNNNDRELMDMFKCIYWGYINEPEKMAALYTLVDFMIYPSLDDNLPNMIMESMSCGTPVIAFRVGGIPDMIDHKKNGYLAEYKNISDMAEGIEWIIMNNTYNRLGLEARKKVIDNYSEEIIARKHIELYKTLLNNGDSHRM